MTNGQAQALEALEIIVKRLQQEGIQVDQEVQPGKTGRTVWKITVYQPPK